MLFCSITAQPLLLRVNGGKRRADTYSVTFDHIHSGPWPRPVYFEATHYKQLWRRKCCDGNMSYVTQGVRAFVQNSGNECLEGVINYVLGYNVDLHRDNALCIILATDVFEVHLPSAVHFDYAWFVFYYMLYRRYVHDSFIVYTPPDLDNKLPMLEGKNIELRTADRKSRREKHTADTIIVSFVVGKFERNIDPVHIIRDSVVLR